MTTPAQTSRMLMACIGDASRFQLVQALTDGARCVTDLAAEVGLSQSCTTRHLQALERRRVVCGARDGKRVMYRLCHEEPGLGPLLAWALSPDGVRAGMIPSGGRLPAAKRAGRARPATGPSRPVGSGRRNTSRPGEGREAIAKEEAAGPAPPAPMEPPPPLEPPPPARTSRSELEDYLL